MLARLFRAPFFAALASCTVFAMQSATAANYDPERVMYAMAHSNPKLKVVTAHRGLYGPGCPENSMCAVRAAVDRGIESVEIDVKESKNGTPWPFHDLTVGRATNYTYQNKMFNPFIMSRDNDRANPLVAELIDHQITQLKLRNDDGTVSNYWAENLKSVLEGVKSLLPNVVIVLDIKTQSAVISCTRIVRNLGMQSQVVLKFGVGLFAPDRLLVATQGLNFAPTVYLGDLDKIYLKNRDKTPATALYAVQNYLQRYSQLNGFTYYEIGAKQFNEKGNRWSFDEPTFSSIVAFLRSKNHAVGNFVPVVEHVADYRSRQSGYYRSNGSCCASLNDYLTKTTYFGLESRDDRTNLRPQVALFNNILTDAAVEAVREATRLGARQEVSKLYR